MLGSSATESSPQRWPVCSAAGRRGIFLRLFVSWGHWLIATRTIRAGSRVLAVVMCLFLPGHQSCRKQPVLFFLDFVLHRWFPHCWLLALALHCLLATLHCIGHRARTAKPLYRFSAALAHRWSLLVEVDLELFPLPLLLHRRRPLSYLYFRSIRCRLPKFLQVFDLERLLRFLYVLLCAGGLLLRRLLSQFP